jgi:hypothetical protein
VKLIDQVLRVILSLAPQQDAPSESFVNKNINKEIYQFILEKQDFFTRIREA